MIAMTTSSSISVKRGSTGRRARGGLTGRVLSGAGGVRPRGKASAQPRGRARRCPARMLEAEASPGSPDQAVFWLASRSVPGRLPASLSLAVALCPGTSSLTAAVPRRILTGFLPGPCGRTPVECGEESLWTGLGGCQALTADPLFAAWTRGGSRGQDLSMRDQIFSAHLVRIIGHLFLYCVVRESFMCIPADACSDGTWCARLFPSEIRATSQTSLPPTTPPEEATIP